MKLLILAEMLCFSIFLSGCSFCLLLPRAHHAQWLLGPSAAVFKQQQPVKTSTFSYQTALASEMGTEEWPRCLRTFWPPTHQERTFGDCDLQATLKTDSPRNGPDTRHNMDEPLKHAQGKKPITESHIVSIIHTVCPERQIETESESVVARGWGKQEWSVTANGHRVSFMGDKKCSEIQL